MIDSSETYTPTTPDASSRLSSDSDDMQALEGQDIVSDETLLLNSPLVEQLSESHVGHWNSLISRTNWEKGELILQWRSAMIEAELPKAAYSDDAWARRVGNVTPQHVGRLRRVAERFASKSSDYSGLYWSHFQAALDWEDAEMWLEGAVQSRWSVAQMRVQRWEAIGAPDELKPREEDVFTAELDEDVNPRNDSYASSAVADQPTAKTAEIGPADIVEGFDSDRPPFETDETETVKKPKKSDSKTGEDLSSGLSTGEVLDSLGNFSDMPEDLAEALEVLKVAILNHKLGGWKELSPPKLIKKLELLKSLIASTDDRP